MEAIGIDAYQKISKDFLETSIDFDNLFEKSTLASREARKIGNALYAKKNHDQHIHKDILQQYCKSVAYAINDSEDLALAYSNRSALLLHLHQYQKCLVDIDRALQISHSDKLTTKLQARKDKCLDLMKNLNEESTEDSSCKENKEILNNYNAMLHKDSDKALKLPSITPSTNIQSASEAVAVEYNEKYGRHLVATRYIKPGEIIADERGYICFPIISKRYLTCSHCLSFIWNGIPCKTCAFAMYCSESCRKDASEQYHDVECDLFQYISCYFVNEVDFVPDLIAAVRLFIIAVKREGIDTVIKEAENSNNQIQDLMVDGKHHSDKFHCCINLLNHLQNTEKKDIYFDLSFIANALFHYTDFYNAKKSEKDEKTNNRLIKQLKNILKKIMGVIDVNTFKYQAMICNCKIFADCIKKCESNRGVMVAPFCSLINHSCNSNCSRMFLPNGRVVIFTVAPVNKGQQLFDSYGPSFSGIEKEERKLHLQKSFNFICECEPCVQNWVPSLDFVNLDKRWEHSLLTKVLNDFKKYFPDAYERTDSILTTDQEQWKFDDETLQHAIKLSELTYKYIDNNMIAALHNLPYRYYIDRAYYQLYGEKCLMPDKC